MSVLQVGKIESSLADALKGKYQALQLPNDSTRKSFLAEHGPSVTVIVDSAPGVDADLMNELVLRNLDQFLTHGTLTTPVVQANGHRRNAIGDNRCRTVFESANDAVG